MKNKIQKFRENHPGVVEVIAGVTVALVALKYYTTQVERGTEVYYIEGVWGDDAKTFENLVAYQRNGKTRFFQNTDHLV